MKISAKLAFFAIVCTLAYLGLAVWGMGGFGAFFSHGALVVVALATLVMTVASLFTEVISVPVNVRTGPIAGCFRHSRLSDC